MNMALFSSKEYSLSGNDIKKALDGDVHVILYPELSKYLTLEDIIYEEKPIVILYETEKNYGHWTCLFFGPKGLEFFDSYGIYPDDELVKSHYSPSYNMLSNIMLDYMHRGGKVEYNNYKFQKHSIKVNTCGKHCVFRIKNRSRNIDEYKKYLDKLKNHMGFKADYDDVVNYFWNL